MSDRSLILAALGKASQGGGGGGSDVTDDEMVELLAESGVAEPLADENKALFCDEDSKIYVL